MSFRTMIKCSCKKSDEFYFIIQKNTLLHKRPSMKKKNPYDSEYFGTSSMSINKYMKIAPKKDNHSMMSASFLQESSRFLAVEVLVACKLSSGSRPALAKFSLTAALSSSKNRPARLVSTNVTVETIQLGADTLATWSFRSNAVTIIAKVASIMESR